MLNAILSSQKDVTQKLNYSPVKSNPSKSQICAFIFTLCTNMSSYEGLERALGIDWTGTQLKCTRLYNIRKRTTLYSCL